MPVGLYPGANSYIGNGVATQFAYSFRILAESDLRVTIDGVVQTLTTHYTVSGVGDAGGGNVTFVTAPEDEAAVVIARVRPYKRDTDYQRNGTFDEETVDDDFDSAEMQVQQLSADIARAFKAPIEVTDDQVLTSAMWAARTSTFLGFDADGVFGVFALADLDAVAVSPFMATLVDDEDADEALSTLGFSAFAKTLIDDADAAAARSTLGLTTAENLNFVPAGAGAVTRSVDAKLRDAFVSVKDFGATGDGVTDDSAAIQAAIDYIDGQAGGTVYFPRGSYLANTDLTVNGDHIRLLGEHVGASSIFSTDNDGKMITVTGNRNSIENLLIYRNEFSSAATSVVVEFANAVQCKIDNCWIQGGYHCLSITGNNCADNVFTRSTFTFATGSSMLWIARGSAGLNGGHHFYRCLFNQEYPTDTPVAADYLGARANSTAYAVGDIVTQSNYYWRCRVAGTSAAAAPASMTAPTAFYSEDVTDGTVTWRLMGHTAYRGAHIDTGTSLITLRECDLTGPFVSAIDITDTLTGDDPYAITVENCTAHGPISNGLNVSAGREIDIKGFNTFSPTGSGTTNGMQFGGSEAVQVSGSQVYAYTNGIRIASPRASITHNNVFGCATGIRVVANTNIFNIVGNVCGSSSARGANTNAIIVEAGTSDAYNIAHNIVNGAGSGVTDGGTGAAKTINGNH